MNGPVGLSWTKNRDVCPITQGTRWGFQRIQPLCREPEQPEHHSSVGFRNSLLLGWCFLSAVCWLLGQLWRVRTIYSEVTGLLFKQEHCWMCGTILSVGISFMSIAYFLWILVCGFQRGGEAEAWPFNKMSNFFFFSWQGLSAIMSVAMASSIKQKSYGINRFFCMF